MRSMFLVIVCPLVVLAYNDPPYEVYPYVAEATDDPPLNYMKVCEPGRSGEDKASYVVLGISFPRTFQAVAGDYDGDLVVPAYIDGLPVRKVNAAAFVECNKLRSVRFPATLREIGDRAFVDCLSLTNVTFESGVSTIGYSVFSNCVSLAKIRFPSTLSRLGGGCFQGCVSLTDVYFDGNAPRLSVPVVTEKSVLGEAIFRQYGYYERFKIHINRNTYGWVFPYEKGVPEKWPVDYGYMQAHETVAEEGSGAVKSASGFVAVVTEVEGDVITVPETWTAQFLDYAQKFGTNFAASLKCPTGKKDATGKPMYVWQDYVAGTDPTEQTDTFQAVISMDGDVPKIECRPALSETEKAKRVYTIYGRTSLWNGDWVQVQPSELKNYNFFKVTVRMR